MPKVFLRSGRFHDETEILFLLIGLFELYLPVSTVDVYSGENCRLLKGFNILAHPRYCVWITFGDGVQFSVFHAKAERSVVFWGQILLVRSILSEQL